MSASTGFRKRHPERARLQTQVAKLKARGCAPGKLAAFQRRLAESKLNVCPKCGLGFRFACPQGLHGVRQPAIKPGTMKPEHRAAMLAGLRKRNAEKGAAKPAYKLRRSSPRKKVVDPKNQTV